MIVEVVLFAVGDVVADWVPTELVEGEACLSGELAGLSLWELPEVCCALLQSRRITCPFTT